MLRKQKITLGITVFLMFMLIFSACTNAEEGDTNQELEALQDQIVELNEEIAQLHEELTEREEMISDLESELSDQEQEQDQGEAPEADEGQEGEETSPDEDSLRERADDVVIALENENFESLGSYVHPEKGIRFSPYAHVDTEEHLVFEAEEVRNFGEDNEEYHWGVQDGSGYDINLTPREYYEEYIYIRDFSREAAEVNINEIEAHGNILVNVEEVYPDAEFVSYFVTAGEDQLDWANLILAFEEHEGDWYLVGLAVDRWTT